MSLPAYTIIKVTYSLQVWPVEDVKGLNISLNLGSRMKLFCFRVMLFPVNVWEYSNYMAYDWTPKLYYDRDSTMTDFVLVWPMIARWFRTIETWDVSTGSFAAAPLTHSLAPHCALRCAHSLPRLLTRSRANGKEVYVYGMNMSIPYSLSPLWDRVIDGQTYL